MFCSNSCSTTSLCGMNVVDVRLLRKVIKLSIRYIIGYVYECKLFMIKNIIDYESLKLFSISSKFPVHLNKIK